MQIGASVVLKSGSPVMTVELVRNDGRIVCVWFDDRQKIKRTSFHPATLRLLPTR